MGDNDFYVSFYIEIKTIIKCNFVSSFEVFLCDFNHITFRMRSKVKSCSVIILSNVYQQKLPTMKWKIHPKIAEIINYIQVIKP